MEFLTRVRTSRAGPGRARVATRDFRMRHSRVTGGYGADKERSRRMREIGDR